METVERMAESLDFTGFLSPESSESVQRRWIFFRDIEQVSLIFGDYFSGFSGIWENAIYEKIQENIVDF